MIHGFGRLKPGNDLAFPVNQEFREIPLDIAVVLIILVHLLDDASQHKGHRVHTETGKRGVEGISNTMLSKSLRELEDAELVKRFEYLEIPVRVEYALTEKAVRLQPILLELIQWEIEREAEKNS